MKFAISSTKLFEIKRVIFAGEYERVTENGVTRELYYIGGNAIVAKNDGISTLYYVHPALSGNPPMDVISLITII